MSQMNKIGKTATVVTATSGRISVVYHRTLVVEVSGNNVVLDTGGWFTATTKVRMNQTAAQFGLPYRVHQTAGKWFVRVVEGGDWDNARIIPFEGSSVSFTITRETPPAVAPAVPEEFQRIYTVRVKDWRE